MGATLFRKPENGSQGDQQKSGLVQETASISLKAVIDSASTDTELSVRTALVTGGYVYGSAHPVLGSAYRLRSQAISQTSPLVFDVSLNYRTPEFDPNNPSDMPPWLRRTTVNYASVTTDEAIDEDINGQGITTAAGEPYQGLTRPFSDMVIRLDKAFESFTASAFYTYSDVVNSDEFLGFPVGVLLARAPTASENEWNGFIYYDVSQEIHVRKPYRTTNAKAWYKRVLHQGTRFRTSIGSFPITAIAARDVLLADDGTLLPDNTSPVYKEFEVFESVAFSGMGWF